MGGPDADPSLASNPSPFLMPKLRIGVQVRQLPEGLACFWCLFEKKKKNPKKLLKGR